ncbi:TPA: flagellar hook capping FlgD N-terminal domain-containing protein [Providencia stuartii]|uniref:flagellar hook assembly protein FlgD n=1 Tax=Providencia stuartii TaxID=588 RepID=UPI0013744ED1|nr:MULTISPECIES: flagellar hook capping FlgD N-terminal domain-containing protein [Providencia]MBN5562773.1 flagellar basal-body rod modification protein [Providencia stuartii]MBN5602404.1 flagellar basal-body rod modification protein [Providencia stuartii]MBN5606500.1 flagellar basal-body rod modification protein [Providencia stuartii]MCL8326679.1 flagellar basal-body rod modification protein [Providencia thailandensis]MDF4174090.1 flagellar hook capping FlgD N-terminal domain-containing prot
MGIAATMYDSLDNTTAGPEPLKSNIPNKNKSQTDDMRDTFLKMIVTQMQNQDPTKPMENAELTSQLAQIATLESMNKLSDKVSGISSQIGSGQSLQATQLVGKGVLIPRNEIVLAPLKTQNDSDNTAISKPTNPLPDDETSRALSAANDNGGDDDASQGDYISSPFGFFLPKMADSVEITIRDKNRAIIRTISYDTEVKPDIYDMSWDGRDDNGKLVAGTNSKYFFDVRAVSNGAEIEVTKLGYTRVNGVTPGTDAPLLDVGIGQSVPLSSIFKVYPSS